MTNNSILKINGSKDENSTLLDKHVESKSKEISENEWRKKIKINNSSIANNSKQFPNVNTINGKGGSANSTYANKTSTSSTERRYEALITKITDGKGVAVTTLGEYFYDSNKFASRIDALEFAWEFLEFEDIKYMDTMITLIKDGWSGTFGELISCAKNI